MVKRMARGGAEEATYRHHAVDLLNRPGVTGVGFGLRRRNGKLTDEVVVKVFVAYKRREGDMPGGAVLPKKLDAPQGASAYVDVEEMTAPDIPPQHVPDADTASAESRLRVARRPAVGGVSASHHRFPVGTVAIGMRDRRNGAPCILSCSHVLSQLGNAYPGDTVLQPSPIDGGAEPLATFGSILRWTPLQFGGTGRNLADAAIAACAPGQAMSWVDGIGTIKGVAPMASIAHGEPVRKVGRTTGLTTGVVYTFGAVRANYRGLGFGDTPALFVNQILAEISCGYGDSGSLLVDSENRAAGLLFGASPDGKTTWFNPFDVVCSALDISLLE
jgi:hypothetical protein